MKEFAMTERTKRLLVFLLLPLAFAAAGCGGDGGEGETPVVGTFVGAVEEGVDRTLAVAVVAEEAGPDGERTVRVYACDAIEISEWLPGDISGNSGNLRSTDGDAQVSVELGENEASGTLTLADGEELEFAVPRARGPAGLYLIRSDGKGGVHGASSEGKLLFAKHTRKGSKAELSSLAVEPDGTQHTFPKTEVPAFIPREGLMGRLIILNDGSAYGGTGVRRPVAGRATTSADFLYELIDV